ncbi:TPA: hypothetical protein J0A25_004583 [Escherichia coli]|nr:hypothetical protein [Escherichia coli]
MKQMSLIEMDGFLKGKCIPRDLKVNETNAEYLVRKFGELESKLETALRECRSAGITIDNLEAKCAKMAAKINVINELMEVAEQVNKLAQEETEKLAHERNTLAAENAGLKATCEDRRTFIMNGVQLGYIKVPTVDTDPALDAIRVAVSPQESTPATDDFLAEVRDKAFNDLCAVFVKDATVIGLDDGDIVTVKEATDALLHCAEQLRKGGEQK